MMKSSRIVIVLLSLLAASLVACSQEETPTPTAVTSQPTRDLISCPHPGTSSRSPSSARHRPRERSRAADTA